jgi:F-type H+-transporting ATPase subunit gamma
MTMATLEAIRKRIGTAEDLQSVVRTMKGVAAANIRQFEAAITSLTGYARVVELGFQALLRAEPERIRTAVPDAPGRLAAVVFGSDQGLCGRFNSQVVEYATGEVRREAGPHAASLLAVGGRAGPMLEADGLAVEATLSPPTSLAGIRTLVRDLLIRLETWRREGRADRILLIYNASAGGMTYRPHTHRLYPLDLAWLGRLRDAPWPSRRLAMHTVAWPDLFAALVREYFHIALFRAAAESLAGENASRLASMQAAEGNIDDRLGVLQQHYRLSRQQAITEELLDIVSGFEALSGH